jgi:hypothetical protein
MPLCVNRLLEIMSVCRYDCLRRAELSHLGQRYSVVGDRRLVSEATNNRT